VWATYRLYHEFAWAYDVVSWLVSLGHWAGWRRIALDHVIGRRVLEVGFGTGELLIEMACRDLHVYGLECSPAMQRVTARKMVRPSPLDTFSIQRRCARWPGCCAVLTRVRPCVEDASSL